MEIVISKKVFGVWETRHKRFVTRKQARRRFLYWAKKIMACNAEAGKVEYCVDCVDCVTGEVVYYTPIK